MKMFKPHRERSRLARELRLREHELREAHAELEHTNSELLQLTLELEDRVNERTSRLEQSARDLALKQQQLHQQVLALEAETTQRQKAQERVDHLNLVLRTIRDINRIIIEAHDKESLIELIAAKLVANRGYLWAWIILLDEAETATMCATAGLQQSRGNLSQMLTAGPLPPCCRAALDRRHLFTLQADDVFCKSCPFNDHIQANGIITSPMLHEDVLYGVVMVTLKERLIGEDEELDLFGEIARDIAYSLHGIEVDEQRRAAENRLCRSDMRLKAIYDASPIGIALCGNDLTLMDYSTTFGKIFGLSLHEDNVRLPLGENPDFAELFAACCSSNHTRHTELTHVTCPPDDTQTTPVPSAKQLEVQLTPLDLSDDETSGTVLVQVQDISSQRQAQRLESIGTLAGGIAHDFNNILSAILGYTELTLIKCPPDTPNHDMLSEIRHGALRARDLVKQILTFSRSSQPRPQAMELGPIIHEALRLLRATLPANIKIVENIAGNLVVEADPTQIHQIIINLCTNALHAMGDSNGSLTVTLESATTSDDTATPAGPCAHIRVRDTGKGMEPQVLERIFEPFFTTKPTDQGTGMGLSVVHGIVQSLKGTITVSSVPGTGTEFTILLPELSSPLVDEAPRQLLLPSGHEHILLVDDEKTLVNMEQDLLEQLGYRVTIWSDGKEALDDFRTHPYDYDLVITDLDMPRMRGNMLCSQLLKIRPDIPVIITSGSECERCRHEGIQDYLTKPVTIVDMARTIREVLDRCGQLSP